MASFGWRPVSCKPLYSFILSTESGLMFAEVDPFIGCWYQVGMLGNAQTNLIDRGHDDGQGFHSY